MTTNRSERIEGWCLVVILLLVAVAAGAASFTHVKEWTMRNSPPGTGAWFGWANAVISELIPAAALLTIRRRRRTGGPIAYPMFLLICAVLLSLSAQLAVAKPGPSGWLLSAVPALAFLGLSKLILTTKPIANPATVNATVQVSPAQAAPVESPVPSRAAVEQERPAPARVLAMPIHPTRTVPTIGELRR